MPKIIMYTTGFCPYCKMAENLLRSRGVQEIEKIRIDLEPDQRGEMMIKTGRRTLPLLYLGDIHVGCHHHLTPLDRKGELAGLLAT